MEEFEQSLQEASEKSKAAKAEQAREEAARTAKRELLDYVKGWQKTSADWREASWESRWHRYRRNSESQYDPVLKSKKENWQSTVFIPMTASHRETIQASLYRVIWGVRPYLEVEPRGTIQNEDDQSLNIRDLILREGERTKIEIQGNKAIDDATTYGSGFLRVRWEEVKEDRLVRSPALDIDPQLEPEKAAGSIAGEVVPDRFEDRVEEVTVYRGVKVEWIDIWDLYPDPEATEIEGHSIAYRFRLTKDAIKRGVDSDLYLPDALEGLDGKDSDEVPNEGHEGEIDGDRGLSQEKTEKTEGGKVVESYEFWGKLPKKWVMWDRQEEIDDPEAMVPARVIFHADGLMAVEVSNQYDGEAPIVKFDYFPVNGQFYGRAIPEMLEGLQEVQNETINQRIDYISTALNQMKAVIEQAVVNPEELRSRPDGYIRLDARKMQKLGIPPDVRAALQVIEMPDVPKAGFADPQEMERYAQERTSANRTTLGTAGQVRDANQTLGGMEMLRQAAGEKFAYIGTLIEFMGLRSLFRKMWMEIYANITPEDVVKALGMERAQTFRLLTPEEIAEDYRYEPQGVFTMETRALKQQRLQALDAQFGMEPWMKRESMFDHAARSADLEPENFKKSPEEIEMTMRAQAQMSGQAGPEFGGAESAGGEELGTDNPIPEGPVG